MKIQTFKYTGNGQDQYVPLGFAPVAWYVFGDSTVPTCAGHTSTWCNRSNGLKLEISFDDSVRPDVLGLYVGAHPSVNSLGVVYYGFAFCESSNNDFETFNYMGNATSGRVVKQQNSLKALAVNILRDAADAKLLAFSNSGDSNKTDGTGQSGVTSFNVGGFVVDANVEANKYSASTGYGEGHQTYVFYAGGSVATTTWVGTGVSGQSLYQAPGNIRAVFISRPGTPGTSARFAVDTMPSGTKPASSVGLDVGSLIISGNRLISGAVPGAIAGAALTYEAVVFFDVAGSIAKQAPSIITKNKRAVYLPGRDVGSYIDCGTSDATLKINGAMTIEWFGVPFIDPLLTPIIDKSLIMRHVGGVSGGAGSASWGMEFYNAQNLTLHWQSNQVMAVVSDRINNLTDLSLDGWRTGILSPTGLPVLFQLTHNGSGRWLLLRNGKLVSQRDIDMTNTTVSQGAGALPNIASTSGHRTVIGARAATGPSIAGNLRCLFMSSRVYNVEQTFDQMMARSEILLHGSSLSNDVTSGLAESWDSANAGGTLLPASVNSANNGTIINGSVITL